MDSFDQEEAALVETVVLSPLGQDSNQPLVNDWECLRVRAFRSDLLPAHKLVTARRCVIALTVHDPTCTLA